MFKHFWGSLNPMASLGEKNHSIYIPLLGSAAAYLLAEFIGNLILHRPDNMGPEVVVLTFLLVLYFSFRHAIRGGLTASAVSIVYFTYFIYSRTASYSVKVAATENVILLTSLYLLITFTVGILRKRLDDLFGKEQQARAAAEHDRRRMEALLKQLPVGVLLAQSPTGEIISRNNMALELLGPAVATPVSSIEEYVYPSATIGGKKIEPREWPLARALTTGEIVTGEEIVITGPNGDSTTLFFNASPVYDKKGNITAAVATFYDITKQKELERLKDDFVAMISHELKTPLTSAKIYAQSLLKEMTNSQEQGAFMEKMNDQLDRLALLVNTMLDTTRLEQGKLELQKERFVLGDIAREIVGELRDTTGRKISLDWQADKPLTSNKDRIAQIFTNLLTNALKFSPKDSEVIVRSREKDGMIVVSVQDFGIGLSQEALDHIFERFYQSEEHKTYPGLGLGLYISSQIIRKLGGEMRVESEKGKGATFSFSLPLEDKPSLAGKEPAM
ncbi:MAG TPA: PAS domain-containing sensor histidine kinase [Candidatus Paceibacterota bacterium]|nr:PAS domain-containing sensor histidine kinase [Candidatus Paceibacterota bacterium]